MKIIEESVKLQGNEWMMTYPWKTDSSSLPNNYPQVRKKLETIERRLLKHPSLGCTILDESRLTFERVRYMTDSPVALAWIRGERRSYPLSLLPSR